MPVPEKIHERRVISVTPHKNFFLMELEKLESLEDAERFRGAEIFIRKDKLRRRAKDEYFWFELIGLEVYLRSGLYLGILEEILETGSNDIYVIRGGEKAHACGMAASPIATMCCAFWSLLLLNRGDRSRASLLVP